MKPPGHGLRAYKLRDFAPEDVGEVRRLVYYAMFKKLDDAVLITRANTEDRLAQFRALCEQYAASLDFDLRFQDFEEEMTTLPGDYASPQGGIFLALRGGQAVGCVALRRLEDSVCEMKRLYVAPDHRGQGIGRALAEEAIDEARRIGYQRMRLDTAPGMKEAGALYRLLGFAQIAPYYHNPIPGVTYWERNVHQRRQDGPARGNT